MRILEKRRAKRVEINKADKKLLALERELDELNRLNWSRPSIPLPKPIQHGWKRHLVLRSDIAQRQDAHILRDIIKQITGTQYSFDGRFMTRTTWDGPEVEMGKYFKPLGVGEFKNMFLSGYTGSGVYWTERHAKWFNKEPVTKWWIKEGGWTRSFTGHWFNAPDYWFEWYVEPHFHTHYHEPDPELESKIKKLRQKLWENWKNTARLHKLHGWKGWKRDDWYDHPHDKIADQIMEFYMREFRDPQYAEDYHVKI